MQDIDNIIDRILLQVQKPARYRGNEWNAYLKDHQQVAVRMVLAFPDLYEVGMANQGLKILYESVNIRPDMLMERVFAPAMDMEGLMRENNLPLFALESQKPVAAFDLVGFSLQYELSFTNVLNMLDLAKIPVYSKDRTGEHPLVVGGGPCAYNPEPLAPFFDFFIIGEAEESLPLVLKAVAEAKTDHGNRQEILERVSCEKGVYVPSFYRPLYKDGFFLSMEKTVPDAPGVINKCYVPDLDSVSYPLKPLVPYVRPVHDRAVVELFRGCSRGCRFCQAGFIFHPVRRRSRGKIIELAREQVAATGYEEISLSSLSSTDYPRLNNLVGDLEEAIGKGTVKCSLPSLRLDSYSIKLAGLLHRGRKSSLTFAPEAATERLRRVIKKNIKEDNIFSALGDAVDAGWQGVKLYFMIGLPTEKEEDVKAIVELSRRIREFLAGRSNKKIDMTVSVSVFVPKAHTPFQWEPQLALEQVVRRQEILKNGFKNLRGIALSWHDAFAGMLEAVFARGDRRLALLLETAWRLGCSFDGWSEYFSEDKWQQAFVHLGLDPGAYAYRHYEYDRALPWDHIHCGVEKKLFIEEHRKAFLLNNNGSEVEKEGKNAGSF